MKPVACLPIFVGLAPLWADAQVIYTDVIPDEDHVTGWTNDTCLIDVDNDGMADFHVRTVIDSLGPYCPPGPCAINYTSPTHVFADPISGNEIADSATAYPTELGQGDSIDASLAWNTDTSQLLIEYVGAYCAVPILWLCFPTTHHGDWEITSNGFTTGFLGLRFFIGTNRHYGWARFSIHRNGTGITKFTLHDYAYNGMPDEMILAGDTGSIATEVSGMGAGLLTRFAPNPFVERATLLLPDVPSNGCTLRFHDLSGREVRSVTITSDRTTIDRGTMDGGFYLYEITNGSERLASGKVLIE